MENKVKSYMGFAAKARKLVTGYNTCIYMMEKRRVKLILITEDLSENSVKKMVSAARNYAVPYRIYSDKATLSHITGNVDKGIYGITDENFAKVIMNGIDAIQSK